MSIRSAIERSCKKRVERGWDRTYWCIDLHGVVLPRTYSKKQTYEELPSGAYEVLTWLSQRPDHCIIVWSSTHQDDMADAVRFLKEYGVNVDYVNDNPECDSTFLSDFGRKFYFDILLDDKAGFDMDTDWYEVRDAIAETFARI